MAKDIKKLFADLGIEMLPEDHPIYQEEAYTISFISPTRGQSKSQQKTEDSSDQPLAGGTPPTGPPGEGGTEASPSSAI